MKEVKEVVDAFKKGDNILGFFREKNGSDENTIDSILISYDLQAGEYRNKYYNAFNDRALINGNRCPMKKIEYEKIKNEYMASIIDRFEYSSILEVGVGEATTLGGVSANLKNRDVIIKGIDISVSRIAYGNLFLKENNYDKPELLVADMFKMPFENNAFDVVYTFNTIGDFTSNGKEAIEELIRITNKYLILIEYSYELGNEETKKRIEEHSFCKNLMGCIDELGLKVIEHKLFDVTVYNNQSSIIIIDKQSSSESKKTVKYCCPECKENLVTSKGNYFCNECKVVYPIIDNIPCLINKYGILYSKCLDEELKV